MKYSIVLLPFFVLATGCKEPPAKPEVISADPRIAQARAKVASLKEGTLKALLGAITEKGAVGAIDVCRMEVPKLGAAASTGGVKVGRSALKLRNPNNAPAPWLAPVLQELSNQPKAPGTFRTVALPGGELGYVEPLYTGGLCLTCHGTAVASDVVAAIDAAYPEDRAKGFEADEFRGVVWAIVPAS